MKDWSENNCPENRYSVLQKWNVNIPKKSKGENAAEGGNSITKTWYI